MAEPEKCAPFFLTTAEQKWVDDYKSNDFMNSDPMIPIVRRSNVPFSWSSVALPERLGRRKPAALKVMDAAYDHGFSEGLIIPFHTADRIGRIRSASCVFFWKDTVSKFKFTLLHNKLTLTIVLLYWAQRTIDLTAVEAGYRQPFSNSEGQKCGRTPLTDRERDVLCWAARGKTMSETGDILGISEFTVEEYVRHSLRKLDAVTKAQAVAKAIYAGLIDV